MKVTDPTEPEAGERTHFARIVSGLYATYGTIPGLIDPGEGGAESAVSASGAITILGEELRLDVDGYYPQMTASGTIPISAVARLHWIAKLQTAGPHKYTGGIWYKDPAVSPFNYTTVDIKVLPAWLPGAEKAKVAFSGGGLPPRIRFFKLRSPYFHKVEFEYDTEQPIVAETTVATCAHPNRPATMLCENLSLTKVFQRAGFDATVSPGATALADPAGGTWSDMEMHDAMVAFWSRFANAPQWALWVLFADQHETGSGLGGIMFDDIGPNHRQGTSLFYNSFISDAPPGDPNPAAWVARSRFWTSAHEMGHAFNLAHSWQKSLGAPFGTPWIPLVDEPEARSFMNYHFFVAGGEAAFFADFEYRFSDQELLFMRHAPARFVRMGDAAWFDHHGFEQAVSQNPVPFTLQIRVNRPVAAFEFMEPVVAELKLKNVSSEPQIVNENVLTTLDGVTIAMKRQGSPARQYVPFAQYCMKPTAKVLQPGQAIYASVYVTAGLNGVDVADPGRYVLQAALHLPSGNVVSPPLNLKIAPPRGYEEERLAQDFFSDEVSRVLAFDGSRQLGDANNVLREVVDRLADRRVAKHSRVPLGLSVKKDAKVLTLDSGADVNIRPAAQAGGALKRSAAQPNEAISELSSALLSNPDVAAESIGHVDYKVYVDELTNVLEARGDRTKAADAQDTMYKILAARNVLPSVLAEIDSRRKSLREAGKTAKAKGKG